ncbi:MAG: metallophosphoesterase, partial [Oscillospiraceae bacterium]
MMTTDASRRPRRRGRRFLLVLLVLAALALFFWWQQNGIRTQTVDVTAPGLPAAFDGLRIVQLSDLHGKEFGADSETLLNKVAALQPDLIAITGDLIDQESQLDMVRPLAEGLAAIAPTYYVTGNHEWAVKRVSELKELLTDCGVRVLTNGYEIWEKDGATFAVAGVDDPNGPADQKTGDVLRGEIDADYTLLLSHRDTVEEYADWGYDLVLCGHGHGGIFRIPLLDKGILGTNRQFFPEYDGGLYAYGTGG